MLLHPDRNGYVYVMDRTNGEVLSAAPYVRSRRRQAWILKTGRFQYASRRSRSWGRSCATSALLRPARRIGNRRLSRRARGCSYIPHQNLCQEARSRRRTTSREPPTSAANQVERGPGGNRGEFSAWDPVRRRRRGASAKTCRCGAARSRPPATSSSTGRSTGWFKAVDARTGAMLWQFQTASGIVGQPVAYRGPDGHEYIAVLSGVGGWAGAWCPAISTRATPRRRWDSARSWPI